MRVPALLWITSVLLLPAALRADVNLTVDPASYKPQTGDPLTLQGVNPGTPRPPNPSVSPCDPQAPSDPVAGSGCFVLTNNGTSAAAIHISISTNSGGSWLSASTQSGSNIVNAGESVAVNVFGDATYLEADNQNAYTGTITVSESGGSPPVTVHVSWTINGTNITVAANVLSMTLLQGQSTQLLPSKQFNVVVLGQTAQQGGGQAQLVTTPSTKTGGSWLSVTYDPANGNQTPTSILIDMDATALVPGSYEGTIVVSCVGGTCLSKTITITLNVALPLAFTTLSLPDGILGKPYSQTPGVSGAPPYTWTVLAGALPAGLGLSPTTGLISGTPTEVGTASFSLQVVDSGLEQAVMTFTLIIRPSASALARTGVLSQVASGGGWKTSVYLINTSTSALSVQVNLWADSGSALTLPLTVHAGGAVQTTSASSVSETIAPNSTVLIESDAGAQGNLAGWAEILSNGTVSGYGVFHFTSASGTQSEGTVPLEQALQPSFDLPFDNVNNFGTGVALANLSSTDTASINATVRDAAGNPVETQTISLAANGHQAFPLTGLLANAAGNRGIIQFRSAGANITGLGLRVNPVGGFTSVPKLDLPVSGPGPAMARAGVLSQVAFGGGWSSLIYLINNTASPLSVTVNFRADDGTPLPVPLIQTQDGSSQSLDDSTFSATIASNSTVVLATNSQPANAIQGWADVLSNGPISGYGVFHFTSFAGVQSEGTVPLESTSGASFILPFDNVNRFQTGVALANLLLSQQEDVSGTVWGANGINTGTTALAPLPSGGHQSFQLVTSFPATDGDRGIVEFTTPSIGILTGLGLRVNPTGGFTSVPKLVRH